MRRCQNCTSGNLGVMMGKAATGGSVCLVICWNCGEIGQWKPSLKEAVESWDRADGGWEGTKGVVDGYN